MKQRRTYLFSRTIMGRTIRFYRDDSRPGVHINDCIATISGGATAATIEEAFAFVEEHQRANAYSTASADRM
jgi:hypothetical protein